MATATPEVTAEIPAGWIPAVTSIRQQTGAKRGIACEPGDSSPEFLADAAESDLVVIVGSMTQTEDAWLRRFAATLRVGGQRPGALLIEKTDPSRVGWHPGNALDSLGFTKIATSSLFSVWQRGAVASLENPTGLLLCAYRGLSMPTFHSVQTLVNTRRNWRLTTKTGDGLISRARSIVVSRWFAETADDVFLMIDDDITFSADVADQIVNLAREKRTIACAAYPVRTASGIAVRVGAGASALFGPGEPPIPAEYAATGFMAVHRDVIAAIVQRMTYCHASQPWGFWPMFAPLEAEMEGDIAYLSEDWAFCLQAKACGFQTWLDPGARIGHMASIELNTGNMNEVAAAVALGFQEGMD